MIYKIELAGQTRLVFHPRGLPPGWKETNATPEEQALVSAAMATRDAAKVQHFTTEGEHLATLNLV